MFTANLTRNQRAAVICLVLALVTTALYWPMRGHDFVNLDDEQYITLNAHVRAGVTWSGAVWAFKTTGAANWHPLTWLSHMLDCQLYGLDPGSHHSTNLLFHVANTLLLFLLLNQLTAALGRSAFVAALFAWHPLHVESVAWAAERKDVLSGFFFLLTLWAYSSYVVQTRRPRSRLFFYLLSLFLFACGLMSKPMVVTLPFVLLLLDFWPLRRWARVEGRGSRETAAPALDLRLSTLSLLAFEKLPFFALSLAGSIVTCLAQKSGGAVWSAGSLPFPDRVANALLAYIRYISKTFWPVDLAVIYPHPGHWPAVLVMGAVLALAIWSGLFLRRAWRNPYLLVGWLWFLGMLVPAIGLVQVGAQSMADRYTYLPSIGLFIVIVWGLNDLLGVWPQGRPMATLAGAAVLMGCLVVTRRQLACWQDSLKLLAHTVAVTTDNYTACNFLGRALEKAGQPDEALLRYAESVRIQPHYPQAQYNLGMAWLNRGRLDEACEHLAAAVKLVPDNAEARYYLGKALLDHGRLDDAVAQFTEALRLRPDFAEAQNKLALAFVKQGKIAEAIPHFAETVRLLPHDAEARFNWGLALLDHQQPAEAAVQFAEELRLTPNETKAHYRLAQALSRQHKSGEAVLHYRAALRLTPDFPEAKKELDELLAAHPELR